jgi:hypothetical protein
MKDDVHTTARADTPSSAAGALTRASGVSARRTLADLTDSELRAFAEILVHDRPTLFTRIRAARVPLAMVASVLVGASVLWSTAGDASSAVAIGQLIMGVGAAAGGVTYLALLSRNPRYSAFAPAVAYLEECGVDRVDQEAIFRLVAPILRTDTAGAPAASVDDIHRQLAPFTRAGREQAAAGDQGGAPSAMVIEGIARDWLGRRRRLSRATVLHFFMMSLGTAAQAINSYSRPEGSALRQYWLLFAAIGVFVFGSFSFTIADALFGPFRGMPRRFLKPLGLGLPDDEEERLVRAFNDVLRETRAQRKNLSRDEEVQLVAAKVTSLLDPQPAVVDSALAAQRRALLHEKTADAVPVFGQAPDVVRQEGEDRVAVAAVVDKRA